jgi:hypothetical protein
MAAAILGILTCFASPFVAAWVLRPMDNAARWKRAPVQFTMLDFLSLTAYFSIPLGLSSRIRGDSAEARGGFIVLSIGGCLIAFLIWWGSVRTAARAGISNPRKRLLMIGVIVPLTYAIGLVGGPIAGLLLASDFQRPLQIPLWAWLLPVFVVGSFIACRKIVGWILAHDAPRKIAQNPWSDA